MTPSRIKEPVLSPEGCTFVRREYVWFHSTNWYATLIFNISPVERIFGTVGLEPSLGVVGSHFSPAYRPPSRKLIFPFSAPVVSLRFIKTISFDFSEGEGSPAVSPGSQVGWYLLFESTWVESRGWCSQVGSGHVKTKAMD